MLNLRIGQKLTYTGALLVGLAGDSAVLTNCHLLDPSDKFLTNTSGVPNQTVYLAPGMTVTLLMPILRVKFEVFYLGVESGQQVFAELLTEGHAAELAERISDLELDPYTEPEFVTDISARHARIRRNEDIIFRYREIMDVSGREQAEVVNRIKSELVINATPGHVD